MTQLDRSVLIEAANGIFACQWADEYERAGLNFAAGTEIMDVYPDQDEDLMVKMITPYVDRLEKGWKRSVSEMFTLMEIPEDEWGNALYYVFMSCLGHGVGLGDDYSENISLAEDKIGAIDQSPFNSEFQDFSDLAYEIVLRNLLEPSDPKPEDEFKPGDRVVIDEARHNSGDKINGNGTVVKMIKGRRDDEMQVVVTLDADDSTTHGYQGGTYVFDSNEVCMMEDEA